MYEIKGGCGCLAFLIALILCCLQGIVNFLRKLKAVLIRRRRWPKEIQIWPPPKEKD